MNPKNENKNNSQIIPIIPVIDYNNPNEFFENPLDNSLMLDQYKHYVEKEDDLVCKICCSLVYLPIHCKSCKNIYCTSCITKWQNYDLKCPKCKEIYEPLTTYPLVKNILSDIRFNCPYSRIGKNN